MNREATADLQIWWLVDSDLDEALEIDSECHGDLSWTREDLSSEKKHPSRTVVAAKNSASEIVGWGIYEKNAPSIEVVRTSHSSLPGGERIYQYVMSRLAYSDSRFFEAYELVPERLFETRCRLLSDLGWIASRTFGESESPLYWPEAEPGVEMIFRRGW